VSGTAGVRVVQAFRDEAPCGEIHGTGLDLAERLEVQAREPYRRIGADHGLFLLIEAGG
jgi:hypothetical protein